MLRVLHQPIENLSYNMQFLDKTAQKTNSYILIP